MAEISDGVGGARRLAGHRADRRSSQLAECIARLLELLAHNQEAAATQEAREIATWFEVEHDAAPASLAMHQVWTTGHG